MTWLAKFNGWHALVIIVLALLAVGLFNETLVERMMDGLTNVITIIADRVNLGG